MLRPAVSLKGLQVKSVLITEYHRIGDVLIIAPVLKMLKNTFPNAKIILLCKNSAVMLARHLKIADEVIGYDVPWTDWNWSIKKWFMAWRFAKKLSTRNIDLAFDFKGDIRNGWFLWTTKAKVSFGYTATGGKYFYTHPKKMNQKIHQSQRAFELVFFAGCNKKRNQIKFFSYNDLGAVVIHVGASDQKRTWPMKKWVVLVRALSENLSINIVRTDESEALIKELEDQGLYPKCFEGNLVKFTKWLEKQKCIVAPDSMAGHLASHIGIPVVSIFGSQPIELTRPIGKPCVVVAPDVVCNHKSNHWRLCKKCINSITPNRVEAAVYDVIKMTKILNEI